MPEEKKQTTSDESPSKTQQSPETKEATTEETTKSPLETESDETETSPLESEMTETKPVDDDVPEAYEFTFPDSFEEGERKRITEGVTEFAKALGLSQEHANVALEHYLKAADAGIEAAIADAQRQREQWTEEARNEWGTEYDAKRAEAAKAFAKVAKMFPELGDAIRGSDLGYHPGMLKLFHWLHGQITEDKFQKGQPVTKDKASLSPAERLESKYSKVDVEGAPQIE